MGDNQVSYMICLFLVHLLYHLGQLPRCFFFISQFQRKPCSFLGFHPFPCAHGDAGSPRWMEAPAEHGNGGESTWFPVDFPLNQWIGWYSTSNGFPLLLAVARRYLWKTNTFGFSLLHSLVTGSMSTYSTNWCYIMQDLAEYQWKGFPLHICQCNHMFKRTRTPRRKKHTSNPKGTFQSHFVSSFLDFRGSPGSCANSLNVIRF